jgi:hypothetical protein
VTRHYLGFIALQPCIVRGCQERVEVAHVQGALSVKTGLPLPRRLAHAGLVTVPLCPYHHRLASDSVHAVGERGFEARHGMPEHQLLRWALTYLAVYIESDLP